MANFIVRCAETRAYRTSYKVQASSAEEARDLVSQGAGVETDDEFIETTDRTVLEVNRLFKEGDKVFWNDPDNGACSREYVIKNVLVRGDLVRIEDEDGSVLECPPMELECR